MVSASSSPFSFSFCFSFYFFVFFIVCSSLLIPSAHATQPGIYTLQTSISLLSSCPDTISILESNDNVIAADSISINDGVQCSGNPIHFESIFSPSELSITDFLDGVVDGPLQCGESEVIDDGTRIYFIRFNSRKTLEDFPSLNTSTFSPSPSPSPLPTLSEGLLPSASPVTSKPAFFFFRDTFYLILGVSGRCIYKRSSSIPDAAPESSNVPSIDGEDDDEQPTDSEDEEDETPEPLGGSFCFPSTATVRRRDGSRTRISNLRIGDVVQTGHDRYAPIFTWTHKQPVSHRRYTYVNIYTNKEKPLTLTPSHYIYIYDDRRYLIPAGRAQPGQKLISENGSLLLILAVNTTVFNGGLFNPHTLDGDIVVDGILTSTYTTAVTPTNAHAYLTPIRALYRFITDNVFYRSRQLWISSYKR